MGIHNRDYMKRRRDDGGGEQGSWSDSREESSVARFIERHWQLVLYIGVTVVALTVGIVVLGLFMSRAE